MKKHWTYYLPQAETVTTIAKQGQEQIVLEEKINVLQKELDKLKAEYDQTESDIHTTALKEWNKDEIREAKSKAIV